MPVLKEREYENAVPRTVTATRFVRKMRGQAQAHLLEADDGHSYVVKFKSNPQHRRILVNEYIASVLLHHLNISTPQSAIIRITDDFLSDNPDVYIQLPTKRRSVLAGRHFGSRCPVDATKAAIYDRLPDALLNQVVNRSSFVGAYCVDRWLANSEAPQAIFFRGQPERWMQVSHNFVAQMIDYAGAFDGAHWQFRDSPPKSPHAYHVTPDESLQPWLDAVTQFPERVVAQAMEQVPTEWLEGDDGNQLQAMLEALLRRRNTVADLIRASY